MSSPRLAHGAESHLQRGRWAQPGVDRPRMAQPSLHPQAHRAIHQTHDRTWRWGGAYLQSHGHSVMARRDIPDGRCHADIAWSVALLPPRRNSRRYSRMRLSACGVGRSKRPLASAVWAEWEIYQSDITKAGHCARLFFVDASGGLLLLVWSRPAVQDVVRVCVVMFHN